MTREEAKRKAKAAKLAKRRRKVNRALLIIQALVSFIFTVAAYKFLPAKYKAAVAIILLLDFFMTYILLVLSGRRQLRKRDQQVVLFQLLLLLFR